jgi:hypothetical protein
MRSSPAPLRLLRGRVVARDEVRRERDVRLQVNQTPPVHLDATAATGRPLFTTAGQSETCPSQPAGGVFAGMPQQRQVWRFNTPLRTEPKHALVRSAFSAQA